MGEVTHTEWQHPHLSQALDFTPGSQKQKTVSPGLPPLSSLLLFFHNEIPKGNGQSVFKASQAAHST